MKGICDVTISVIVPVYNVEEYLSECIDSILSQTYQNFELILVDDGSKDNSGNICDLYQGIDSRITVFHKKNGGLSSARNVGIDNAKGEYIVFIDSDDLVHPEYLERMIRVAVNEHTDIVACHFIKGEKINWENNPGKMDIRIGSEVLDKINVDDVTVTVAWNKLYRSGLFLKSGLRFPQGKIHEDMFMTPQVLAICKKMILIPDKLYFYRIRPDSIMTNKFSLNNLQALEAIEFRISFFKELGKELLVTAEYEGLIRKSTELYFQMSEIKENRYAQEMLSVYNNVIRTCFKKDVFKQLQLKYKFKLIMFYLYGKKRNRKWILKS